MGTNSDKLKDNGSSKSQSPSSSQGNSDNSQKSSLKKFLVSPLIKSDSKALQYSGLGIQLVGTILVFLFIGVWLDGEFGTKFIWTLVLTFVGFAGGFYSFILTINKLTKEEAADKSEKKYIKYDDDRGKGKV
jgi:F0F1-type ATP synthase assembly protein I